MISAAPNISKNMKNQKRNAYQAAWSRQWRKKNKARYRAIQKRYELAHPEIMRERRKRSYKKHKSKRNAEAKAWCIAHPDRVRENKRKRSKRQCAELAACYVRKVITRHSSITAKEIPESFVQLYREYINLRRLCKKSQTSTN